PLADFVAGLTSAARECELEPGPERLSALRATLVEAMASPALLQACQAGIQAAIPVVDDSEALLALTAGGALSSSCVDAGGGPHAFWDVLFQVSLTDAVLSGALLTYLALESVPQDGEAIQEAFARALAQGDEARNLDELGASGLSPKDLADAYRGALREPYHLQLDAIFHLAWTHVEIASGLGKRIANEGVPVSLLDEVVTRWREAFERDVDEALRRELKTWCRRRLETLRDDPDSLEKVHAERGLDAERLRAAASLLALRCLEPSQDGLLQAVHIQSLQRSRIAAHESEQGFVEKLWAQPNDGFALEEFERFLLSRSESSRSRRVHRFRAWVRTQVPPSDPEPSE
ncbi:MAG: hypothetical protein JKY65_28440, partial [Planctomycetes bacterium]|nr:hypothetical protein [Planctomycetota bacterium]